MREQTSSSSKHHCGSSSKHHCCSPLQQNCDPLPIYEECVSAGASDRGTRATLEHLSVRENLIVIPIVKSSTPAGAPAASVSSAIITTNVELDPVGEILGNGTKSVGSETSGFSNNTVLTAIEAVIQTTDTAETAIETAIRNRYMIETAIITEVPARDITHSDNVVPTAAFAGGSVVCPVTTSDIEFHHNDTEAIKFCDVNICREDNLLDVPVGTPADNATYVCSNENRNSLSSVNVYDSAGNVSPSLIHCQVSREQLSSVTCGVSGTEVIICVPLASKTNVIQSELNASFSKFVTSSQVSNTTPNIISEPKPDCCSDVGCSRSVGAALGAPFKQRPRFPSPAGGSRDNIPNECKCAENIVQSPEVISETEYCDVNLNVTEKENSDVSRPRGDEASGTLESRSYEIPSLLPNTEAAGNPSKLSQDCSTKPKDVKLENRKNPPPLTLASGGVVEKFKVLYENGMFATSAPLSTSRSDLDAQGRSPDSLSFKETRQFLTQNLRLSVSPKPRSGFSSSQDERQLLPSLSTFTAAPSNPRSKPSFPATNSVHGGVIARILPATSLPSNASFSDLIEIEAGRRKQRRMNVQNNLSTPDELEGDEIDSLHESRIKDNYESHHSKKSESSENIVSRRKSCENIFDFQSKTSISTKALNDLCNLEPLSDLKSVYFLTQQRLSNPDSFASAMCGESRNISKYDAASIYSCVSSYKHVLTDQSVTGDNLSSVCVPDCVNSSAYKRYSLAPAMRRSYEALGSESNYASIHEALNEIISEVNETDAEERMREDRDRFRACIEKSENFRHLAPSLVKKVDRTKSQRCAPLPPDRLVRELRNVSFSIKQEIASSASDRISPLLPSGSNKLEMEGEKYYEGLEFYPSRRGPSHRNVGFCVPSSQGIIESAAFHAVQPRHPEDLASVNSLSHSSSQRSFVPESRCGSETNPVKRAHTFFGGPMDKKRVPRSIDDLASAVEVRHVDNTSTAAVSYLDSTIATEVQRTSSISASGARRLASIHSRRRTLREFCSPPADCMEQEDSGDLKEPRFEKTSPKNKFKKFWMRK
ncbi:uncharacterized protein LOC125179034 [Hyalella azteca]|uniref:Uncharacterized protein LOC125179034 n=1 Tax=Hyalella azteca TaxID=294128 RepID=A0A979FUL8_HYAAZ|nr:uncharacterized protein LOC125179034 [Hyalella azteca]XP_047740053.1 uncharacterized protein LOC125179034 [Hyalella azteca]